ncbi:ATP-dependent helicase, partial [Pseudomonas aeruginosa]
MEIDTDAQESLKQLAQQHHQMEQNLAELVDGRMPLPAFKLAKPPREYQRFAGAQVTIRGGLLLADDLGLGKTITGICPMAEPGN